MIPLLTYKKYPVPMTRNTKQMRRVRSREYRNLLSRGGPTLYPVPMALGLLHLMALGRLLPMALILLRLSWARLVDSGCQIF